MRLMGNIPILLPALFVVLSCLLLAPSTRALVSPTTTRPQKTNVIAGASGYIGKSVVQESVRQGYHTVALVRDLEKVRYNTKENYAEFFRGATILECDVTDPLQVNQVSQTETLFQGASKIVSLVVV